MKRKKILIIVISLSIFLSLLVVFFTTNKDKRFALDKIYDVLPEEVRDLYINMVSVSCNGDIHFNIDIDSGEVDIKNMNKLDLLNYMFSYLDKHNLLNDKLTIDLLNKTEENIFYGNLNLINQIKDYQYNDYIYNIDNNNIIRKSNKCISSDIKQVTHVFGYFYDDKNISIDMNTAYVKDNNLYDYNDNLLGKYTDNKSELSKLTEKTSYYRIKYTKDNGRYKLISVEWLNRG